jgi:hypothetical protein
MLRKATIKKRVRQNTKILSTKNILKRRMIDMKILVMAKDGDNYPENSKQFLFLLKQKDLDYWDLKAHITEYSMLKIDSELWISEDFVRKENGRKKFNFIIVHSGANHQIPHLLKSGYSIKTENEL